MNDPLPSSPEKPPSSMGTINKQSNSNTYNDNDNDNDTGLPFDIIADIISRLPLKLIIACKFLSKTLNNVISGPSFSTIYHTNKSTSCTINIEAIVASSRLHCSLDLVEFDQKDFYNEKGNRKIRKYRIFNAERLPGGSRISYKEFDICGYCNGLICLLERELGSHKLFVINPILGEFIQLAEHVGCDNGFFSYGLGYCQLSNRYKVLRVITEDVGGGTCKTKSEIFTIGYDQIWRCVNVPYNIDWYQMTEPRPIMVPLRSALHWILLPVEVSLTIMVEANWKDRISICAFDMTEEKFNVLQLPHEISGFPHLSVLSEKLCLFSKVGLWVMDEYGVEGSWTKKLVLKMETLSAYIPLPLTVSPEGGTLVSVYHKFVVYDMREETCLSVIYWSDDDFFVIPYVPNFVSLRNLVQPSGSITDVQPCSLVSETASAPLDHQLQQ